MSPWMVWESVCCYRLRHIRCAYEYGVPQASGQFYSGDGPYDGGVWDAERHLVDPWKLGKDGPFLGGGFTYFFILYPDPWGKLIQIDFAHMVSNGLKQPPPRFGIVLFLLVEPLVLGIWISSWGQQKIQPTKMWRWPGAKIHWEIAGCVPKADDSAWIL